MARLTPASGGGQAGLLEVLEPLALTLGSGEALGQFCHFSESQFLDCMVEAVIVCLGNRCAEGA